MANKNHIQILTQGVRAWNAWREKYPDISPDLSDAYLRRLYLRKVNFKGVNLSNAYLLKATLSKADLSQANLSRVVLRSAYLREANLSGADLSQADLKNANLVDANLDLAILRGSNIYGLSAWNLRGCPKDQTNLVITNKGESVITVDDLEMAQFIYLIINHRKLRNVINSVTKRGVLILGRFSDGGREVLQGIANKMREAHYLPIVFDFERPKYQDYTETIKTLTGLSRFVVADLSGPSVPHELFATIPNYKIPFVPIIEKGGKQYSMFKDMLAYPWVLKPVVYKNLDHLIELLTSKIIPSAERKHKQREKLLEKLFP